MTAPTLYNFTMSICSMKCRLALEEAGQPYEDRQVDIGFALENFEPWYVRLNANAVVPTLVEDGEVVTDSATILRRIAERSGLLPSGGETRARALDLLERGDRVNFQVITYARKGVPRGDELLRARVARATEQASAHPDLLQTYLAAAERIERHAAAAADTSGAAEAERRLGEEFRDLDAMLGRDDFLSGDSYGIADVIWTVILARTRMLGLDGMIDGLPRLAAYYDRMTARPSFAAARVMPTWKGGI